MNDFPNLTNSSPVMDMLNSQTDLRKPVEHFHFSEQLISLLPLGDFGREVTTISVLHYYAEFHLVGAVDLTEADDVGVV